MLAVQGHWALDGRLPMPYKLLFTHGDSRSATQIDWQGPMVPVGEF